MSLADANLTGKLLIAMPDMSDPRFASTVIFMCSHSDEGAMGLIINKPQPNVGFGQLLKQLGISKAAAASNAQVYFGGPVERQRGFVLHGSDYSASTGTVNVNETFRMTATLEVLEDMAKGAGPDLSLLALGYAGWGPGQLEFEITQNGWLSCAPTTDVVFGAKASDKWTAALNLLGIDPLLLSATAGRA
ncbi:YqgE/AlgH family protein [Yoonia sp.]|uniref:YqgE/AlgH family protein n=1 Tax=Yoonia sp. TaxID=2212373 RepID=UPI0035C86E01